MSKVQTTDNYVSVIDRLAGSGGRVDSGYPPERLAEQHARKRILTKVASQDEIADYAAKYGDAAENQKMDEQRAAEYAEQQRGIRAVSDLRDKYPELFE